LFHYPLVIVSVSQRYDPLKLIHCRASGALRERGVQYVIHAVGPKVADYSREECKRLVAEAYHNSLMEAELCKLKRIALPAISSGE